jgi:hypothetical protein
VEQNIQESFDTQIVERSAVEAIERAQIDTQIATAKKYPVHSPGMLSQVKAAMLSFATLDEETASGCFYTLPRGGKAIQGPSVRMAEIAISCYGNIRDSVRVIEVVSDGANPHVLVQAVAHDLERNVAISIEKRRRIVKKKNKNTIDEDDINLAVNACTAIAFRDAAFKVIPLALIKPVVEAAKKVAVGDIKSLAAKRTVVVDRLKQMGATEKRILAVVGCNKIEDISFEYMEILIGLGTALKDGETTLEEAFPEFVEHKPGVEGVKDKLKKQQKQEPEPPKQETSLSEAEKTAEEKFGGEVPPVQEPVNPEKTEEEIQAAIEQSKAEDAELNTFSDAPPPEPQKAKQASRTKDKIDQYERYYCKHCDKSWGKLGGLKKNLCPGCLNDKHIIDRIPDKKQ